MASTHESKSSKASEEAMKDADRHAAGNNDAVPSAESGSHAHSPAAHLHGGQAHTKAVGDLRAVENKEESTRESGRATESYRNA